MKARVQCQFLLGVRAYSDLFKKTNRRESAFKMDSKRENFEGGLFIATTTGGNISKRPKF